MENNRQEHPQPDPREALIDELARALAHTITAIDYPTGKTPADFMRVTGAGRTALKHYADHQEARR